MARAFAPVGKYALHLCVDMQRLFAENTPWRTPWIPRVTPNVARLIEAHPRNVAFTRFIPAKSALSAKGTWRRYYQKWAEMTLENLEPELIDIIPELHALAPEAKIFDKTTYSPWSDGKLHAELTKKAVETLVISGAETEVCVAATVLGAIDLGYRVVVATDAICSSGDSTHDAMIDIYHQRYSVHVSAATTDTILKHW